MEAKKSMNACKKMENGLKKFHSLSHSQMGVAPPPSASDTIPLAPFATIRPGQLSESVWFYCVCDNLQLPFSPKNPKRNILVARERGKRRRIQSVPFFFPQSVDSTLPNREHRRRRLQRKKNFVFSAWFAPILRGGKMSSAAGQM